MTDQAPGKKRELIAESSKMMFVWVACMSAVVGICLVVSYFLWQQLGFRTNVVNEKNRTVDTLRHNNDVVDKLKENIRVLDTNAALNSAKADSDEKALQVILDALPADNNATALGASLQQKLFADVSGLTVDSLSVGHVDGEVSEDTGSTTIGFTAAVSATDLNTFKELLQRFERSIRVIDIDEMAVTSNDKGYSMTLTAHAYYEPAKVVELKDKVVPSK
jgi:hypothetical protein